MTLQTQARPGWPTRSPPRQGISDRACCCAWSCRAWRSPPEHIEAGFFGRAWLEALVLAILIGTLVRFLWRPGRRWLPGIALSAKTLLEIAVVLLGASLSAATIAAAGAPLLLGIAAVVSRGDRPELTASAACSACRSAWRSLSPAAARSAEIQRDRGRRAGHRGRWRDDVAASIAFTAVLGVAVVLGLPLLIALLGLSVHQFGILAGLTVYAVPQVLAATAPAGQQRSSSEPWSSWCGC